MSVDQFGETLNKIEGSDSTENPSTSVVRDINNIVQSNRTPSVRGSGDPFGLNFSNNAFALPPLRITNNDFLPAADNPILQGNFAGRFVNSPIFAPSLQMPFSAAALLAEQKRKEASAKMLQALKPINLNKPKTKHPKFQKVLDDRFFSWLSQWEQRVPNITGGWDNLFSGKTPTSIDFQREYASFERMRRNSDFLVDRMAEVKNFETQVGFRVDPKSRRIINDVLNGVQEFETGNFADISPLIDNLDATKTMSMIVAPHIEMMRTEIKSILDGIEGPKNGQWWATATSRVEDFMGDGQVDALVRQLAIDNPDIIYSKSLDEENEGLNDDYVKRDQVYTEDDVRYYFEALLPKRIQAQRQLINKPQTQGGTRIDLKIDNIPKVEDVNPDYLLNTWSPSIQDLSNSNSLITHPETGATQKSVNGAIATFNNGELIVTPSIDWDATLRTTLYAKLSPEKADASMAHLRSAGGTSARKQIYRSYYEFDGESAMRFSLRAQSDWYRDKVNEINTATVNKSLKDKYKGLLGVVGHDGSPIMMVNGSLLEGVNEKTTGSGKKQIDMWNMTVAVNGVSRQGVLVPETSVSDDVRFSTGGNVIADFFGEKNLRRQGLAEDYVFLMDLNYKEDDDGNFTIVNDDGGEYKGMQSNNAVVIEPGSVSAFAESTISKYLDAYSQGFKYEDKSSGIPVFSTTPTEETAVFVPETTASLLLNPESSVHYLDTMPDTMQDLAELLQSRQFSPEGLLGNFDATRNEIVGLRNSQAMGQFSLDEDFARFLYGAFYGLNGGAHNRFMRTLKYIDKDKYDAVISRLDDAGRLFTFAEVYPFLIDMLKGVSSRDGSDGIKPSDLATLWAEAIKTSVDSGIGADEVAVFITNSVKSHVANK